MAMVLIKIQKADVEDSEPLEIHIREEYLHFFLPDNGESNARHFLMTTAADGQLRDRPDWDEASLKSRLSVSIPSFNVEYILIEEQEMMPKSPKTSADQVQTKSQFGQPGFRLTAQSTAEVQLQHQSSQQQPTCTAQFTPITQFTPIPASQSQPLYHSLQEQPTCTAPPLTPITQVPASQSEPLHHSSQQHRKKGFRWTNTSTLRLINLWTLRKERFNNNTERNEDIWQDLADAMKNEGYIDVTGVQCENKFKYLKKCYIETKDINRKSTGQPEQTCQYYEEMDEIFKKSPQVTPPLLVSSRDGLPGEVSQDIVEDQAPAAAEVSGPPKKKTRLESSLTKWAETFQSQAAQREEARQKRHEETMQLNRELQNQANETYKEMMLKILEKL